MDFKKSFDRIQPTYFSPDPAAVTPVPTVNARAAETKSKTLKLWNTVYAIGIFGCAFLLFHLYINTTFHHAVMDHNLHRLEEEMHSMMEMHLAQANATTDGASGLVAYGGHGNHRPLDHHTLPHERRNWASRRSKRHSEVPVKRGGGATFTWFHPGAGACGGHQGDGDFIIAISHLIWDGGSHCGDTVTITYQGKSVQATVADECMGCDPNHIDLSPGLLHHIAGPGVDMVSDGAWSFGGAPAPPPEKPKPKPTTTYSPPPHTTTKAHTTTSTSTTSSHSSSTTSSSASSTISSSSAASASASATPVYVDDGQVHNLEDINVLLINIGGVAMSAVLAKA